MKTCRVLVSVAGSGFSAVPGQVLTSDDCSEETIAGLLAHGRAEPCADGKADRVAMASGPKRTATKRGSKAKKGRG